MLFYILLIFRPVKVIVSAEGSLFTQEKIVTPVVRDGLIQTDVDNDMLKIVRICTVVYMKPNWKLQPGDQSTP